MTYDVSPIAVAVFLLFVGVTIGLTFYLGRLTPGAAPCFKERPRDGASRPPGSPLPDCRRSRYDARNLA